MQQQTSNLYECGVQGSTHSSQIGHLLTRLRGLCSVEVPLNHRELVFRSVPVGSAISEVRARYDYNAIGQKWWVRYISTPHIREKLPATIRNIIDIQVSNNIATFLEYLGYKYDFEYILQGYQFTYQRSLTIKLVQIKKTASSKLWQRNNNIL
eukprot:TRINITY_DN2717_c0_g1_i5.p1 TRINITY_DN2717_c0_g1~~TRINITY_DN2717_c0_g1_i5.p1  ORF type:complete len:175 (-),score=27.05 TRINITY_DN2717_c0_g1_i5:499-957(-)